MNFTIEDFTKTYKGTRKFTDESPYFREFLKNLEDTELQSHIKFCNDVLEIPPIEVYIKSRRDIFNKTMAKNEKLGLGACFGFLFQYGEYKKEYGAGSAVVKWVGDEITGIKNASYFKKRI